MSDVVGGRERQVLRALVENHIENPAPVASRTLSRKNLAELDLSPATIRSSMVGLDEMGYIAQPHTSAGRVPTDKGYRFFINELMIARKLPADARKKIDCLLALEKKRAGKLPVAASKVLATCSRRAAVALLPKITAVIVNRFYFIKVSDFQIQVILKTSLGGVENLLVEVDENWADNELDELANFLNMEYAGNSLRRIREKLRYRLQQEKARASRLRKKALLIQEKLIAKREGEDLVVEGASTFFDAPEFSKDAKKLKKLFGVLADKKRLLKILDKCLDEKKVSVNIGSEFTPAGFEDCALVAISYGSEINRPGAIGVIGPRRMDYAYIFGLLEYMAGALNKISLST